MAMGREREREMDELRKLDKSWFLMLETGPALEMERGEREMIWGDCISWGTWSYLPHTGNHYPLLSTIESLINKHVSVLQIESKRKVLSIDVQRSGEFDGFWHQLRSQEWAVAQSYSEAFSTGGYRSKMCIFAFWNRHQCVNVVIS